MLKMLREWFTPLGLVCIGLLLAGGALFLWFLWVIEQAAAAEVEVRAISAETWCECYNMPRGNQEMEEDRYECWKQLTGSGRFSIDPKIRGDNQCVASREGQLQ